jgi:hypothetical protein
MRMREGTAWVCERQNYPYLNRQARLASERDVPNGTVFGQNKAFDG